MSDKIPVAAKGKLDRIEVGAVANSELIPVSSALKPILSAELKANFEKLRLVISRPTDFGAYVSAQGHVRLAWKAPANATIDMLEDPNFGFEIAYKADGGVIQPWIVPQIEQVLRPPSKPEDIGNYFGLLYFYTNIPYEADKMHTFYVRATCPNRPLCPAASYTLRLPDAPRLPDVCDSGDYATDFFSATITWRPPTDFGDADFLRYEIKHCQGPQDDYIAHLVSVDELQALMDSATWQDAGKVTQFRYSSLPYGRVHYFRIRAVGAIGAGAEVDYDFFISYIA